MDADSEASYKEEQSRWQRPKTSNSRSLTAENCSPMSNSFDDPTAWLGRSTEKRGRLNFPGGVVGKTTYGTISLLILWVAIVWRSSNDLLFDAFLLLVGLIVTAYLVWWTRSTQSFAERNPAQAMLEGAEFVEYHRFQVQAKGLLLRPSPLSTDPGKPPPPQITDDRAGDQ
jgi:hypothetical protein